MPIESGTTEDDVVQYVRERVFKLEQKDANNNSSDEDSIGPDTNENVIDGVEVTGVNDSVGERIGDKDGTNDEAKDDEAELVADNDDEVSDSDGMGMNLTCLMIIFLHHILHLLLGIPLRQ